MYSAAHAVGGQSVPKFDYDLAPGVRKTFKRRYIDNIIRTISLLIWDKVSYDEIADIIKSAYNEMNKKFNGFISLNKPLSEQLQEYELSVILEKFALERHYDLPFSSESFKRIHDHAWMLAEKETDRATYQSMEALVHNLNTMHSRAGAQVGN